MSEHGAENDAPVCACGRTREHVRAKASGCGPVWREPPEGWHTFGTHSYRSDVRVEFSDETDDGGMPLWERVIPPAKNGTAS